MTRSLTADDLIQLPRLSANEAAVLATELLGVAATATKKSKGHALPATLEPSRKRLAAASEALGLALTPAPDPNIDTQAQRKADRAIDNAWSATFDWLQGWTKQPAAKNPDDIAALFALIFPDALAFTRLPYKVEWQESQNRLAAIAAHGGEKTFKALGGEVFLTHIQAAHKAYGAALGITEKKAAPAAVKSTTATRDALNALLTAVRTYVNKVTAYPDPDIDGSEELATTLLDPLATWKTRETRAAEDGAPPATTTPAAPPSPAAASGNGATTPSA